MKKAGVGREPTTARREGRELMERSNVWGGER